MNRDPKPENLKILDLSADDPLVQRAMVRFVVMLAEGDRARALRDQKRPRET